MPRKTKGDLEEEVEAEVVDAITPYEKARQMAEEAPTPAEPIQTPTKRGGGRIPKIVSFPYEGKINKYGFLHFDKNMMHTLGFPENVDLPILFLQYENGRLTIARKGE